MNIVFFCRFFHPHIGGVEKHVLNISLLLRKQHLITVITEQYDESLPLSEQYEGIQIIRIPFAPDNKQKKYHIWNYLYKNIHLIKRADVIHIHDVFYWYFPFRFIYPRKNVYMTFHGYEGNSLPSIKAIVSHKIAESLTWGNICIGDYLSKWYKTKPSFISYGAIVPVRENYEKISGDLHIVYVGRLEEEAGIMQYLQLIRNLKKEKIPFHVTVLGDGSLRKRSEKYVEKNHLPVTFLGFVPDVETYILRSHVIFTSRFLGTMESMNYKRPVFCVYNNEIKRDCFELSPFKDYLYMSDSVSDLTKQFIMMLQNQKEMKQKVKHAYTWVKTQTWKRQVKQYEKLWRKK